MFLDGGVILPFVRAQATGAILDAALHIAKIAAALITQRIQGAITKQTAEGFRVCPLMAGEILTLPVLKEIVVRHGNQTSFHGYFSGGRWVNSMAFPVLGWQNLSSFNLLFF